MARKKTKPKDTGQPETLDLERLRIEYVARVPVLQRLEQEALFILESQLREADVKIHSVTSRVKETESLIEKVKQREYTEPLLEIHDTVGLRTVCLFLSDLARIGSILREAFDVLSEDNKIEDYDASSFGYLSVHFVVRMRPEYKGPRYDQLKDIPFEIQVRTIAMHAWATISHYMGYKHPMDVPTSLRRDFYALSGLFYVADTHFEMFFAASQKSREAVTSEYERGDVSGEQEINVDTLGAYLTSKMPDRTRAHQEFLSMMVGRLATVGYRTIAELDEVLESAADATAEYEKPGESTLIDGGVLNVALRIVDPRYLDLVMAELPEGKRGPHLARYTKARKMLKRPSERTDAGG